MTDTTLLPDLFLAEYAVVLSMTPRTLRAQMNDKRARHRIPVRGYQLRPRGPWRFPRREVEAFHGQIGAS